MKSSVPCDQSGMCVTCVVLILFFFSRLLYACGLLNPWPTKHISNQNLTEQRGKVPFREARRAVGQGVPALGSAWGGQLDWPCRADIIRPPQLLAGFAGGWRALKKREFHICFCLSFLLQAMLKS